MESLNALLQGMGLMHLGAGQAIMLLVSLLLLWLAIAKKFEPLLLLPIGFGGLLSNIPEAGMALTALESLLAHHDAGQLAVIAAKLNCAPDVHAIKEALALALPSVQGQMENLAVDMGYTPGVLALFYKVAIGSGVAPLVIFMGVGAMTDFGPLLANPRTLLLGAAAQFGIFATVLGALTLNYFGLISFTLPQAAAIGIIGGADGPTAIYLSGKLAPELLGAIAVAAYSYMALVDQVLAEIPRVREDLGFIPLVTPTSQIVGTQAVLNVLTGERYKTIAKETAGILKGEYGHTPVPVNAALQARVLEGGAPVTCRPADLLKPELAELEADVRRQAQEKGITLAGNAIDDVLTVALFPQIGLKFLENRHNPAAFEPLPQAEAAQPVAKAEKPAASGIYTVEVEGKAFVVKVSDGGDISQLTAAVPAASSAPVQAAAPAGAGTPVTAPLAGNIWKVIATEGQTVAEGDVLLILEAMKMETEIRAAQAGTVRGIAVKSGDAVSVGDTLMTLA
ncbi:Oxaloacetate decarboxylase alpha chain [Salmonella enterica subsp. enterica serovar Typhimurium str. DT104]|nr:sodium ion-translocating decarboxylase subunit beta [Salmonella enterica]CQL18308.1 Oxaloacetate decarboxylase alpha chain [Salmonella enterica subsp. enterica serovar Typhimurium str. DT104]